MMLCMAYGLTFKKHVNVITWPLGDARLLHAADSNIPFLLLSTAALQYMAYGVYLLDDLQGGTGSDVWLLPQAKQHLL